MVVMSDKPLICHSVLSLNTGVPFKGRYMRVKCKPDDKYANCVKEMGPLVPLSGQSSRLPPSEAGIFT
uniref:Uncharacterized protein n=1 Tax=Cyprinus carpio TaxID=7962 RepID=A0A8C2L7A9_CYPCA